MDETTSSPADPLVEAREAYERGHFQRTLELTRELAESGDPAAGTLARDGHLKLGEVTAALADVSRLRRLGDTPTLRRQARFLLGRLRETDPSWTPRVPDGLRPVEPRPAAVLHLLKESLPYSQTGYTFRSRMTLEAQRRAGLDPVVVTSLGFPGYQGVEAQGCEVVDGIRHHRLSASTAGSLGVKQTPYDVLLDQQAARTASILGEERPALVQAGSGFRGYDQALVGVALADRFDLPFVYEVRGFLEATWSGRTDLQERGEYYRRRRQQDERCMRRADLVITIAGSMRDELVARGLDPDRIQVVPNAVDVDRFTPRSRDEQLARDLGIADRFVVGYVSNLGAREGIDNLLRATAILRQNRRDVACLIVGDGPERESLARLADELGIGTHVVMTGHVQNERIEDHYALIDAFVVPRIDDQAARLVTPLKPLEAMAMRIPVIASDLPALREIVAPGERGLVTAPGDPTALARTIEQVIDDPAATASLVDAARAWVVQDRTLDANVERYRSALGPLLGHDALLTRRP